MASVVVEDARPRAPLEARADFDAGAFFAVAFFAGAGFFLAAGFVAERFGALFFALAGAFFFFELAIL